MNRDTKLTIEQLQAICEIHNVKYRYSSRITSGFSNEVHRINDDIVIKMFNSSDVRKYRTEAALLSADLHFPKPKLVVGSENSPEVGRSYVIMTYVYGNSLGTTWHKATNVQREKLIEMIC